MEPELVLYEKGAEVFNIVYGKGPVQEALREMETRNPSLSNLIEGSIQLGTYGKITLTNLANYYENQVIS